MIKVEIDYNCDQITSISIIGHGEGEKGYDLVCAGVSSCFVGAMNALEKIDNYEIIIESGNSSCKSKGKNPLHDQIVLETLVVQLYTISKEYPREVKVFKKGK
jgi:uncharacterized protein YsxB (DUF464 family)